ncbi:gamma-carboxyglutamic acid protein 3 splice variant A [Salpingoeca rosetta]|uniref:Gamma-carboxyglutamic acid protein 3 splice variant A n=1 Tax=Salpingoeca rosetta (strain ATCC 50818 / BSB-021) TaxID=946362 RepID=F2TY35_SALR5|nr:gamma-carboxyglutamic acid protein 3 splice variant A [Salpingoeca rosetta]EGD76294.1 gamma-carboxyglutamic acid protein 3 splice variant A [Salpingoeca rosetta]|eukprot:XP_004998469.1 gamma-carboxyglutamic acid protein 3 splice variant A [Salpingoeca rosetta]
MDVDECAENGGVGPCDGSHGVCSNTIGSYECGCDAGYALGADAHACEDVNECRSSDSNGCDEIHGSCVNVPGSYECACEAGWQLSSDSRTCEDANECAANGGVGPCDSERGSCANTIGSYTCSCDAGYELGSDGHTCEDVNECLRNTHECSHYCKNTRGSYVCTCPDGFVLDASGHNCFFFFSTPVGETTTTTTTTTTSTTTTSTTPTTTTTTSTTTSEPATTTAVASTTTTSEQVATSAVGPVQVLLTESLSYANLNCTPDEKHVQLAEDAGVRDVVISAFASVAQVSEIVPVLFISPAEQALVLQYAVVVNEEDVATAEQIASDVADEVTNIMKGIEEDDAVSCVFFVGVDFTRKSDKEVIPNDTKLENESTGAGIPIVVIAGVAAVCVLLVLVVIAVGVTRRRRAQGGYGFSLGAAKDAETGDFDNPMYSTRRRNVGFDNPIYDDLDDGEETDHDHERRGSLEWDSY